MSQRRPKVFHDGDRPGGVHFDAYYDKKKDERRAHERGLELKILTEMGERSKDRPHIKHVLRTAQQHNKALVTLPALKWMKP